MKNPLENRTSQKLKKWGLASLFMGLAASFLVSCLGDGLAGGSSSTETGDAISLTGRVIDKNNAPLPGIIVSLAKTGVSDTTDTQGKYSLHSTRSLAKISADSVLDTLLFKQNGQQLATLSVTHWVDTLPDLKIIQRDISGLLLASAVQVTRVEGVLSGDGISAAKPLITEFFYNPLSTNYSGFVYFRGTDSIRNYAVYVNVYNDQERFTGRSKTVPFNSNAGNITIPAFNSGNAIPTAYAGKDTVLHENEMLVLHGAAVDSFGGTISKWEWDIGGTGAFKTIVSGDTTILLPASPINRYLCILRVTDNDGNKSLNDTMIVQMGPSIPPPLVVYTRPFIWTNPGVAIIPDTAKSTDGGPVTRYSISPTLPAGMTFDTVTGLIKGTPTTTMAATEFNVIATSPAWYNTADTVSVYIGVFSSTYPMALLEKGKNRFNNVCSGCHGPNAKGTPGITPPLYHSDFLMTNRHRPINIQLLGLPNPFDTATIIIVNGKSYKSSMPSVGGNDSDIAGVLTFVRTMLNGASDFISVQEVAQVRDSLRMVCQSCGIDPTH